MKGLLLGWAFQEYQILFVCKGLVTLIYKLNQKNRRKFDFMYYLVFNAKQDEISMRSTNFWKCANLSKILASSGPPAGSVWIGTLQGASWIASCPSTFLHVSSLLSQQIEPSKQYLSSWDILFSLFVGWHYLLLAFKAGKIHRKWPVQVLSCFYQK